MKNKKKNLTQKEFDRIHELMRLQVPVSIAARIIGKSASVVYYVRKYPDMQSYLAAGLKRVRDSMERTALKKRHPLLTVSHPKMEMTERMRMRMQTNVDPSPFMSIGDEVREIHAKVKKLLELMSP